MERQMLPASRTRVWTVVIAAVLVALLGVLGPARAEAAGTGSISGTVVDDGDLGIPNVCVGAAGIGNEDAGTDMTDVNGEYTITGLGTGNFAVSFVACGSVDFVVEHYDDKSSFNNATPVPVTDGVDTPGIDAELADGGSISGEVTSGGTALDGACVEVSGPTLAAVTTDASGQYTVRNLAPGDYTVSFEGCDAGNYVAEHFDGATEVAAATPAPVTAHATTTAVDADLAQAGSISGNVTDTDSTERPGVCVRAHRVGSSAVHSVETDASGGYQIDGLATGSYKVEFDDCSGVGVVGEFWNDQPDLASADVVAVAAPSDTAAIDAELAIDPGTVTGSISGQITDAADLDPLAGICVTAHPESGSGVPGVDQTNSTGDYEITGLAEDDYRVEFASCGAPGAVYFTEYYDDQPTEDLADPVFVEAGSDSPGIDAGLEVDPSVDVTPPAAPAISASDPSSPGNVNTPAIVGTAEAGSTVRVYASSDCSGTPTSGTATQFAFGGIQAPSVPSDSAATFTATATDASNNTSSCSGSFSYTEDSTAPSAPTLSGTTPASPANDNSPEVSGSAESGSTVRIYRSANCNGAIAATGPASLLTAQGITVSGVQGDATTTFTATATDSANNTSVCSSSLDYLEDSTAPAAPNLTDTDPDSPANDNEPKLKGSAAVGSTIKIFTGGGCGGSPAVTSTTAQLEGAGITMNVGDDTTTSFRATATDAAGNASACSAPRQYVEDSTAPTAAFASGPAGITNDGAGAFVLRASEGNVSFRCSLDGGPFSGCSATPAFGPLDGDHTLSVTATDAAGNPSPAVDRSWTVDPDSEENRVTGSAAAGGVVTSDPAGTGPSASRPVTVAVTVPAGGNVTTVGSPAVEIVPPSGFTLLGGQLDISAPAATAAQPLRLDFRLDSSQIPSGTDRSLITPLRDGAAVLSCLGSSQASPNPCVTVRETLGDGDLRLVVLTSQASTWRFAVAPAPPPPPPPPPPPADDPPSDPPSTDPGGGGNPPPPAVQCVVPNLKGMSTSAAKTALETARCTLGKITKKKVKKGKSDKVLTQSPAAGQAFAVGTPVSVTVTSVKKKKKKK